MKTYHVSPYAVRLLQALILAAGVLLGAAAFYFLAPWPVLMYSALGLIAGVILIAGCMMVPLYFRRLECTLTASHIHVRSGVWFQREESVRLKNIQFLQVISGPFDGRFGMNFLFFHAYGGSMQVFCLSTADRKEIVTFLQQRGICHVP